MKTDSIAQYSERFKGKGILISPYSSYLPNKPNAKNYPYWEEVVAYLNELGAHVFQVGYYGERKIKGVELFMVDTDYKTLSKISKKVDMRVSVDNFYPHFCHNLGLKCTVIFSQSDPDIFGYDDNVNLIKGDEYLRPGYSQFDTWHNAVYNEEAFVHPLAVLDGMDYLAQQG